MVSEPLVQPETKGGAAGESQRSIVPRHIDPLEPIIALEIAQTIPLLVTICETRVHEIWDLPIGAGSDGFGNQRIRRSLVPMLDHRDDVHQPGLRSAIVARQLDKADQLLAEVRSDKDAAV